MFSKKLRALAFFLMTLMVFYVIPVNCMKDIVSALSSDETVNLAEESKTSFDEEPYVLGEDLSKREESAKHFRMSDGSYVAVQYAEPVHYLDENGETFSADGLNGCRDRDGYKRRTVTEYVVREFFYVLSKDNCL